MRVRGLSVSPIARASPGDCLLKLFNLMVQKSSTKRPRHGKLVAGDINLQTASREYSEICRLELTLVSVMESHLGGRWSSNGNRQAVL